ncbi:TPR repeat family protein, partial [Vibrio parahaemolyticus AQ3810]
TQRRKAEATQSS